MGLMIAGREAGYERLMDRAAEFRGVAGRVDRLRALADALWDAFGDEDPSQDRQPGVRAVSWIGFYEIAREGNDHGATPGAQMVLLPHRPKPACSPIELHGMCGRAFLDRVSYVVRDVRVLGEGYVACDPRDQSELIVPLFEPGGAAWGVLDADSYAIGAFTPGDAVAMRSLVEACGLSEPGHDAGEPREL